jgi:alpha-1,6-mannosyltransferase
MKILYCTNFYTRASGGVKTYIHSVGAELLKSGLPFRLVVPGAENGLEEEPGTDSRVYILKSPRFPINREYRMILPLDFLPWFRFRLGEIIRRERPDVVEVSDTWTLIYMARALRERPAWFGLEKSPLVAAFSHDRFSDYMKHYFREGVVRRNMLSFAGWYMKRIFIPSFDLILTNSDYTEAELKRLMGRTLEKKNPETHVVPLGVDSGTFHPSARDETFRREYLAKNDGFLLLYAGRLSREKGLDRLMKAMSLLRRHRAREIKLLVVGDGALRKWVEGLGLENVSLLGHIGDRKQLARIFASSDAFITPSIREGFGIAQLEAMSCGVPVVCPDVAGQMSYMGKLAGVVTGHSPNELREAVLQISSITAEKLGEMGRTAREIAERYSWSETTGRILDIYKNALGRPVSPSSEYAASEMRRAREIM